MEKVPAFTTMEFKAAVEPVKAALKRLETICKAYDEAIEARKAGKDVDIDSTLHEYMVAAELYIQTYIEARLKSLVGLPMGEATETQAKGIIFDSLNELRKHPCMGVHTLLDKVTVDSFTVLLNENEHRLEVWTHHEDRP